MIKHFWDTMVIIPPDRLRSQRSENTCAMYSGLHVVGGAVWVVCVLCGVCGAC